MKAPIKMYTLKPIVVQDFVVELPKCMYKLNSIHNHKSRKVDSSEEHVSSPAKKLDIFDQNCQEIPGMAALEVKQKDILDQLAQLKKQISSLKHDLNIQSDSNSVQVSSVPHFSKPVIKQSSLPEGLVINANPSSPPYSLELLQKLLRSQITLAVTSYQHSTVVSLPEPARQLRESLLSFEPKAGVPVLNFRLIWKNITSNSELLVNQTPISGEPNLLRFLSRVTTTDLSYDSDANSFDIDSLLDQCFLLVRSKTKVEKNNILQSFNKSLGKYQWLLGRNQAGIADIAAFSAIKQNVTSNELSANLTKWYQRVGALVSS